MAYVCKEEKFSVNGDEGKENYYGVMITDIFLGKLVLGECEDGS